MRTRADLLLPFLLVAGVAWSQEREPPAAEPADADSARIEPLAYSPDGRTIRLVPLRRGRLPDLEEGEELHPTCGEGVDPRRPVWTMWLPDGDLLARRGGEAAGYSHFRPDADGRLREVVTGAWPADWACSGAADVDGDGHDDLLLTRKVGKGFTPYAYRIAAGQADGRFDFGAAPVRILSNQWAAVFTLEDVTGDGWADLVYCSQAHGAAQPVTLFALPGRGDGTFPGEGQARVLVRSRAGATMSGITLEDFDGNGYVDVFLAPDDDVSDNGQAHLALGRPDGVDLGPSIDFEPGDEGWTSDQGSYRTQTCDVNLDRKLDVIVWYYSWQSDAYTLRVYFGDGRGGFGDPQVLLEGAAKYKPTTSWRKTSFEW